MPGSTGEGRGEAGRGREASCRGGWSGPWAARWLLCACLPARGAQPAAGRPCQQPPPARAGRPPRLPCSGGKQAGEGLGTRVRDCLDIAPDPPPWGRDEGALLGSRA